MPDRKTPMMDGQQIAVPVAASAVINAGEIVVANAAGFAAPGSTATTLTFLGRADEAVDNTDGANGGKSILVRRRKSFKWENYASDLVTQADLGKTCYIHDAVTVAKTSGTSTRSAAGKVLGVEADGVWVEAN